MGDHQRVGWRDKLKNFVNPMFICMLIGMAIGIFGMSVPSFFNTLVSSAAGCMSPIAHAADRHDNCGNRPAICFADEERLYHNHPAAAGLSALVFDNCTAFCGRAVRYVCDLCGMLVGDAAWFKYDRDTKRIWKRCQGCLMHGAHFPFAVLFYNSNRVSHSWIDSTKINLYYLQESFLVRQVRKLLYR